MLVALSERPLHGYAIKQRVQQQSGGALELDPGALYRHLSKLLDDGMVREVPAPEEDHGTDSRRRYYRLTAYGLKALDAESTRLEVLLANHARVPSGAEA